MDKTQGSFGDVVSNMRAAVDTVRVTKRERLRQLDFFILDNSIRESTVGQIRSHTLQNKIDIYRQVKKCGITSIIVATFSHMTRVDDQFCQWLKDEGADFSQLFAFSEVTVGIRRGRYDTETLPVALTKNKEFGIYNVIFEVDLASTDCKWGVDFTVRDMCELIAKRMKWVRMNIRKGGRIVVNLRDLAQCMLTAPERLLTVVKFLAEMPEEERIFAIVYEEPTGDALPEELEAWTAAVRKVMDASGWSSGKLLVHIHQKWDLQTACVLDCLSGGADGVWCSLCEEGAAMGHASSSVTLLNLIRLGNKKVLKTYNCKEFRRAAVKVTSVTTGKAPHPRQVVYGERAVDIVFGESGMGGGEGFNMAEFFEEQKVRRISTLATEEMVKDHLVALFGENDQFTLEVAHKMKEKMLEDLRADPPRKEEYTSPMGVAVLFDRVGGKLTEKMAEAISNVKLQSSHHESIIKEIRQLWDEWDLTEKESGDDRLQFDSFYHGFMAPYFGCYRCSDTRRALQAIDMDNDGYVDWKEILVYIKWALHQYPQTISADDVLAIAFEKGIIPAMRDEQLRVPDTLSSARHF